MEKIDMCDAINKHQVRFVLNPTQEWDSFPQRLQPIVCGSWVELKFYQVGTTNLNPEIDTIPNNFGGIYIFLIKPNVVPEVHMYLAYIGRARITSYQNLRKRVKEYQSEDRLKIRMLHRLWGKYLYVRYLPLKDNKVIDEMEKELIRAVLPPFNDQYPDVYNQPMRAAF